MLLILILNYPFAQTSHFKACRLKALWHCLEVRFIIPFSGNTAWYSGLAESLNVDVLSAGWLSDGNGNSNITYVSASRG